MLHHRVPTLLASLLLLSSCLGDESLVTTPLGAVQGVLNPSSREFHALPYAAPPTGALRWAAPAPVAPWAPSVLNATVDGPGCVQVCLEPSAACPMVTQEDCLYLNVYTPRAAAIPPAGLPVLVWIHGGNFRDGFGGGSLYNGSVLAQQGMIVVTINYRLGVMGWLFTNATADNGGITGNFGFLDQRAALTFVRDNIAPFGGDPKRVTLMGQSAGAMSTASHLISPGSAGLFTAAVLLSEPFALPFRTVATALDMGSVVLGHANCSFASGMQGFASPAACMRAQPADALLAAQVKSYPDPNADWAELLQIFMPLCPTVGTPELGNWPLDSFQGRAGAAPVLDVPIMMGTVSQEGTLFIYSGFGSNVSVAEYQLLIEVMLGDAAAKGVARQYPIPSPEPLDARPLASIVTTASIFKCTNRNASQLLAASAGRRSPIFVYEFSHLVSWAKGMWDAKTAECYTAVCHGGDLPQWFMPFLAGVTTWTPEEYVLGAAMQGYLGAFVRGGAPSLRVGALPAWPPVGGGRVPRMQLDTPAVVVLEDPAAAECALFDQTGYNWY